MKVIHISPSYYPAIKYGGPIQSVHLLNKYLVKNDCNVDVLTTNAGLSRSQRSETKGRWNDVDGVKVKYVNYWGPENYNFSLALFNELKRIITHYDLMHITAVWNFPVWAGYYLSKKYNIPYLISTHGALMKNAFVYRKQLIKKFYLSLIAKNYLKNAKAIHFTTLIEKDETLSVFPDIANFMILPNGVETKVFFKNKNYENPFNHQSYILYVGRIHRIKGLDILLKAMKGILNKELILVLAGPDEHGYKKVLEKLAAGLNISAYLKFTGQVGMTELLQLFKNAKILVLPSFSENFGMSAVEAMACGTPILISNKVGLFLEIQNENAGIIVTTTPEDIRQGVEKILNDQGYARQISENGMKLVKEKYNIEKVADQMIEQYASIIKNYK